MRRAGLICIVAFAVVAIFAPVIAPNDAGHPFSNRTFASPTRVHFVDAEGWHAPFIYRQVLVDRLMHEFGEDQHARIPLRWFADGRIVSVDADAGPLLLLGGDDIGRDVFSRLVYGTRLSLGVTVLGALGAVAVGAAIGALAGVAGGLAEIALMWIADFMLVLPAVYLVLALRAVMPLTLPLSTVFLAIAAIFAAAGWPRVARGVRGIVATERAKDYAQAARAIGAGPWRVVGHVLPAARGFLGVELLLLVPAMLVGEVTLSYLGLGFQPDQPSWGTMLQSTTNVPLAAGSPWLFAPAAALFLVVLALQLAIGARGERAMFTASSR
jgi:peptide/nickel transport system permease protein